MIIPDVEFPDGSVFRFPEKWKAAFVDTFGFDESVYPDVVDRLRFVTGKYVDHRAWPCSLDGVGTRDTKDVEELLDQDRFYLEDWDDWPPEGRRWGKGFIANPPTHGQVAEGVMYKMLRGILMQEALQTMGSRAVVVRPETFVREHGFQPGRE